MDVHRTKVSWTPADGSPPQERILEHKSINKSMDEAINFAMELVHQGAKDVMLSKPD